jgi:hypothetical protein
MPDWKKLTIAVLLFLIMPFPYYVRSLLEPWLYPSYWTVRFIEIDTIYYLFKGVPFNYLLQAWWLYYLLGIIISYPVSCSIIFGYRKLRHLA